MNTDKKRMLKGEETRIKCPACGNQEVKKLLSVTGFMDQSIGTYTANLPRKFSRTG